MPDTTLAVSGLPAGWVVYTKLADASGNAWNGTAWVPYLVADWATYAVAAPETPAGSGAYVSQFPLTAPAGYYTWTFYKQAAGSPASTDTEASFAADLTYWNGSTFGGIPPSATTATSTGIAPALNGLAAVYCTDENIALRAWSDFTAICPPSQKLAAGTDGVILSTDRWTLTSATVDFAAAGVIPGCMVWVKHPSYPSNGEIFAVNAVNGGTVTLRRMGQRAAVGQPPSPAAGLAAITFSVLTFAPQIDVASYDANHFFGIDPLVTAKAPAKLYDQRELQSYVVLMVLRRAYAISLKVKAEDYALKLEQVSEEFSDLTARLVLRWGSGGQSEPPTTIFSTRIRR